MKLFHVVLAIPFFFSSASYSQETNRLILNTFSYQCPQVVTRDVSASLQNIEALKNLAMELKNDAACGNANELAIVATRYADLFEDLQVQNEEKRNKLELEKKVSSYIQIVNDETVDTVIKDGLKTDLVLAQSELIGVNSKLKRFENFSGRESKAANQLIYATEQFLQNLNSNPACIEKKGVKVSNLVSNALLTVAAFSNPGTA